MPTRFLVSGSLSPLLFKPTTSEEEARQYGLQSPFLTVEYDFRLRPL